MLTYNELKEKYKDRRIDRETYGPSKDDLLYQKYLESKPRATGGTANPIFSTNPKVKENKNLTGRETKTYAEHLQESQNRAAALAAQARPAGETPSMQAIKEMIFGRKEGGTINPTFSAADFNSRYDKMQERERAAYNYFRSTGREKEAADYLKAIEPEINRRAAEQRTTDAKKLAEESTMGGLYARYMANLTSPLGAIYGAVQEARGEAIDPNSPLFWGQQTQEGQTEGFLGESTGGKRLLKEAALGAFDWGTQVATLGALGVKAQAMGGANSALYGTSAFAGNVKDATERGATGEEAIFYGAIGAAAEIVTEKIGFDRLFELGKLAKIRGGKKGLVKEILKNIVSEAGEEGSTEVANLLADMAILGDRSQMAEIYQAAQAQGMTEKEAVEEALKAAAGQIVHSAAVGGISGGMIAGGVAGLSGGLGRNMLDYTDEQKEEIKRRQAEKEAARNKDTTVETVGEPVENGGKLPENVNEPPETVTGQAENVTEPPKTVTGQAEIEGFGEEYYGGKGKAAFIRLAQEKGTLDFTPAFNTYYRAGIAGITESEIRQTAYTAAAEKLMLNEAYMAGAEDRKAEIANAIRGRNKLSGKRGLILGEDVKATKGQLAIAKLYADIGGVRIRLVDQIDSPVEGAKVNGYQEGDTITIALNADSFMGTMHHEMVHYIRRVNPAAYDSMRELVFNLANKSGIDMDAQMDEYRTAYMDTYGEDADMMVFMEEMVADAFQKITGDQTSFANFINDLRKTEPTLLEKIKEFLDQMVEFLESLLKDNTYTEFAEELSKDKENLKKLRKEFARALTETGKMEGGTQEAQEKYSLNKRFPKQYDAWDGKKYIAFEIGVTSEPLKQIGIQSKRIIWHSEKIRKIKEKHKGMTDEVIKQVPRILEEPIIVMKSSMKDKGGNTSRITIFGEVKDANGVPVLAVVELLPKNKQETIMDFQVIASAYGKTGQIKRFIENSEVLFLDENKKRTDTWLKSFGLQLPSGITQYGSIGSITYGKDTVNVEGIPYRQLVQKKQIKTVDNPQNKGSNRRSLSVSDNTIAQEKGKNNNKNITKFSLKGSFAEQVDAVLDETKDFAHSHVYVMDTPKVLTDLGLRKLPMLMTAKHVYTTVKDSGKYKKVNYHGLGANLLKQIPSAMEKPVAIMESATKNDSVVMVLELVDKEGRPIIAAIKMNGYGNYEEVEIETNVITSVYGRQGFYHFMDRAIRENRMLYFDKEKSQLLKETPGVQFPDNLNEANFTDSIARFQEKNNNKNITKFSLKQPMEETKDLIAIHNISEGNLKRTLELGGFPMPSIAITREEMKHSKFGEISIIFPKDTIDPADKRNKVFSADAWTPTFPRIEYEVDEKSREALRKRVNKLEIPDYYKGRVMGVISSLEDSLRINGGEAGLIEDVIENRSLQAAYLAEQGRKIEIEQREKKVEPDF